MIEQAPMTSSGSSQAQECPSYLAAHSFNSGFEASIILDSIYSRVSPAASLQHHLLLSLQLYHDPIQPKNSRAPRKKALSSHRLRVL